MKVFLSWSGSRSHEVALQLHDWLPSVLHYIKPWISSEDIDKGSRWLLEIGKELQAAKFGIICILPENIAEPWLHFEAGAMSLSLDKSRVSPFLLGVEPSELSSGPLAQFQSTVFEKKDFLKLIHSVHKATDGKLSAEQLNKTFDLCWTELKIKLEAILKSSEPPKTSPIKSPTHSFGQEEIMILSFLAKNPDGEPTAGDIASAIRQHPTRTQHFLDRLLKAELVRQMWDYRGATYYLTEPGRAYVVENNLI